MKTVEFGNPSSFRSSFRSAFSFAMWLVLVACSNVRAIEPPLKMYSTEILADDPVCYFRFEDGDAQNRILIRNASTTKTPGPDGLASKAMTFAAGPSGIDGRAASFDGASDVEIAHHETIDSNELTVEFWFRTNQLFDKRAWPASATLVTKATARPGSSDWTILGGSLKDGVNEGRILVGVGPDGGGDVFLASGPGLNDGQFHHLVWSRTTAGMNVLYVDGSVSATLQDKGGRIRNHRPIQVGGETFEPAGSFFKGEISALAIYTHVLKEDRIQSHFTTGTVDPRLPPAAKREVHFALDIKPIFQKSCYECHGPGKDKGGLSLATRAMALDGGESGKVIVPGKSAVSPLISYIAGLEDGNVMPPEGERLSAEQIGLVRAWIDQGAVWPAASDEIDPRIAQAADHWSFKPLKRPALPNPRDLAWIQSPIDSFVLARLDEAKLSPAVPATKESLLRRVYFDLTGLPPGADEIKSFTRDVRPKAYQEIVENLLASSAYGERWARHWLDLVRYADSGGYETDIYYEQAWRYRDYVIRSFNEDKPYDQFLMEQVAGDELWPERAEAMQDAVAVWTLGQWPNSLDQFPEMLEYTRRTDQVVTLSEAMLGLTVGCANCHNHKYDPISQRDYFGLEAIFAGSETWDKITNKKAWGKNERKHFRILRHASTPAAIRLLARGELTKPRGLVSPALPAFLPGGGTLPDVPEELKHRRAQLARWLVSPQNPLTARVVANRIWQWHFGQALASTPNDLGTKGQRPSHPELLDWLASELIENGWSLKKMHRLVVLSSTYQQSAVRDRQAIAADPQDNLLAGFPRRRLEAEEVWDHLHAAAGTLDRKSFGPPFVPKLSPEELKGLYDIEQKPDKKWPVTEEQNRRAIYILNRRSFRFPFFEAFDPATNGVSCPIRQTTTVPAQALTLLNNSIVVGQANAMAERLVREAGTEVEPCVRLAWLLAYSREPTKAELQLACGFIADAEASNTSKNPIESRAIALAEFCLAIVNTTEFLYAN